MTNKLKWTSKAAKPFIEEMHQALLSGVWGDIFDEGFRSSDIDWVAFHASDDQWEQKFSSKQVRDNLKNWIDKQISEKSRATNEEAQFRGGGNDGGLADDFAALDLADDEPDPKKVQFPSWIVYYKDIRSSDEYATCISLIPQGIYYARISGTKIIYEIVVDPTLCDPELLLQMFPAFNDVNWGGFMQSFAALGRLYIDDQQDYQYPDRIRLICEHEVDFDSIEQNFVARGAVPPTFVWTSPYGNRFLMTTVVKTRDNAHRLNAGAHTPANPLPTFVQQPNMMPNMQHAAYYNQTPMGHTTMPAQQGQPMNYAQQQNNSTTPQQRNGGTSNGFQFSPQPTMPYQSPPLVQPMQNFPSFQQSPMMPPLFQPNGLNHPSQQQPHQHQQQQQQQQQAGEQQQQQQQPFASPQPNVQVQYVQQPPTMPAGFPHNGFYPTPGVPAAAGLQRTHSDHTEVTVEPAPKAASRKKAPDPTANRPFVETVDESPTAKPVKKKSYFTQAFNYVRGGSDGSGSDDDSHMKQPQKYHAVEEDGSL